MSETILNVIQIILGVIVVVLVMLQAKSSGFSTVFGGGSFQTTRRGSEKTLHQATVIFVVALCVFSLARIVLF